MAFNFTNWTAPTVKLNLSKPFPVELILNLTRDGDITAIFTQTNLALNYLPVRLLMFGFWIIFYNMIVKLDRGATRFKAISVSSIIIALLIGIASYGGFIEITDAVLPLALAGITAWLERKR